MASVRRMTSVKSAVPIDIQFSFYVTPVVYACRLTVTAAVHGVSCVTSAHTVCPVCMLVLNVVFPV